MIRLISSVNVSSNGRLDFVTPNEPGGYITTCLPAPPNIGPYDFTIFPMWQDLKTDVGSLAALVSPAEHAVCSHRSQALRLTASSILNGALCILPIPRRRRILKRVCMRAIRT